MSASRSPGLIAAVDIGSAKVACFVARDDDVGGLRVVGIGHQASHGVQAGTVVDMEAAGHSVAATVSAAEEMTGETLRRVWVNVSGGQLRSHTVAVDVTIAGHEVGDADLRRVVRQSRHAVETEDLELLHAMPVGYSIDGTRGIRDPRGMVGERLGVNVHMVTALKGPLANLETCVLRCHLDIAGHACSPYAAALASVVKDEMDLGVTVIDMGGGTTSFAVFLDGDCVHVDALPVGGQHVTTDIARVLSTPAETAERLKVLHGSVTGDDGAALDMIDVPIIGDGHVSQVCGSMLTSIIRPRVEEILEMVKARLARADLDRLGGRRFVLTGGASQLHGMTDMVGRILGGQVRTGQPIWLKGLASATGGPAFATCAGLLRYGARGREVHELEFGHWPVNGGLVGRVGQWLREYL